MSWSLRLHNGDFALSGAQFDTVTNYAKLTQDLRCAILEKMGNDDAHPTFGSLINGGTTPDGVNNFGAIGLWGAESSQLVESEIQRIVANYQSQQLARAKDDRTTYNRVSLTPGEVLVAMTDVRVTQLQNALETNVTLQTAAGDNTTLALTLSE